MKTIFVLLVICALCVAFWCFFVLDNDKNGNLPEGYPREDFSGDKAYRVQKVVDGDTIRIDYNGRSERVRLIGVDTPEMNDPKKDVRASAKRANAFTKKLLRKKTVYLRFDRRQARPIQPIVGVCIPRPGWTLRKSRAGSSGLWVCSRQIPVQA